MTPPACSVCGDVGWLSGGPAINGAAVQLVECSCGVVVRRRQEHEAKQRAERAAVYLKELRAAMGRMVACTFDAFDADRLVVEFAWNDETFTPARQRKMLKSAAVAARLYAAEPARWLYLYGPPGGGKSHLAAAIANDCAKSGMPTAYASAPELLAYVKRGFDDGSGDLRFESLQSVELLVLDDLGTEKATEWTAETLFRLIDERSKHARATVLTSNVHYDALAARLASRIAELSVLVPMIVSDYRRMR